MANNRFQFPFFQAFEASTGAVGAGWKLNFYAAGSSSTRQNTYSNITLTSAHSNPVVADAAGRWPAIFLSALAYNVILTDEADVVLASVDNVVMASGLNDTWNIFAGTPTRTSATTFTVTGDQTATFQVGRRLKFTDSSTLYGTITVSAYTTLTTVTVVLDSGSLSASLTAVYTSIIPVTNRVLNAISSEFTPAGTGAVATDVQTFLRRWTTIENYGGGSDKTAAQNTAALHAARDYLNGLGGGTIFIGSKSYPITEFTFGSAFNVSIEGFGGGRNYGLTVTSSRLFCTTGVWAVRIPPTSQQCALRNLVIESDGAINTDYNDDFLTTDWGVEYGIIDESVAFRIENVAVYGFQHGCTVANYGINAYYENLTCNFNTRVGFAIIGGTVNSATDDPSRYALYHPNLTAPTDLDNLTMCTINNLTCRRNGWGVIVRNGAPTFRDTLVESNVFGGIVLWDGSIDSACSPRFEGFTYVENNWLDFKWDLFPSWNAVAVSGFNYLRNNGPNYIALSDGSDAATCDFGFQVYLGSASTGTTAGPSDIVFNQLTGSLGGGAWGGNDLKCAFFKQCFRVEMHHVSVTSGDTANHYRFGNAGGFVANRVHFIDCPNALNIETAIAAGSTNRCAVWDKEGSAGSGGLSMTVGAFRSAGDVAGNYETTLTGVNATVTGTVFYRRVSNVVTLDFPALSGTSNNTAKTLTGMTDTSEIILKPTRVKAGHPVICKDNGGTNVWGTASVGTDGVVTLYPTAASGVWTNSGACSIDAFSITYNIE